MSIELHQLQRIRVATESTYGTDLWTGGSGSTNFIGVPIQEGTASLALNRVSGNPQTVQQYQDAQSTKIPGLRSWEMSFTMPLHALGTSAAAGSGTNSKGAADAAILRIFKAVMGGLDDANTGSTFATITDADSFTITDGTDFTPGGAVGWANATGGVYELREINQYSSTCELKQAFSAAPTTGQVAYAATTAFLDDVETSLQFVVEGKEADDRWLLMGGQATGGFTLNTPHDDIWTVSFTLSGAEWENLGSGTLAVETYNNYSPIVRAASFCSNVAGTQTLNTPLVSSVTFAPNITWAPVKTPNGRSENIYRMKRMRSVPACTVTYRMPFQDTTYFTARDNQTFYSHYLQGGTAAGAAVLISVPRAQIVNAQRVDEGALSYTEVTAEANYDNGTGTTTARALSALRLHWG